MAVTVLGLHDMVAHGSAVRTARRWLSGVLAADHADISDSVVLLTCELVTNSIRHSDSSALGKDGQPGGITILVLECDDHLRVEVTDAGSPHRVPCVVEQDFDGPGGRGLHIVNELTGGRWGTHVDETGRVVWFALPLARE